MSYWRAVCRKTGKHGSGGDARKRPAMNLAGRLPYQAWGAAKATRELRLTKSTAYAACWTLLKAKYRIARYEDLPAAKYADCVAFIRQSYQALTGEELNLPEQGTLDLGGA